MIRPPKLIHPVKISLEKIDPTRLPTVDPQFNEPMGQVKYLPPMILTAQLGLGRTDEYYQRPLGDFPKADGHVTFSIPLWIRETIATPGIQPQKGDRIIALYPDQPSLTMAVTWTIMRVEPRGHYPGQPWLWFCFYQNIMTMRDVGP